MNIDKDNTINPLETTSQKVHTLLQDTSCIKLILPPKYWEPFFLKVVSDFCLHHNIPKNIDMPTGKMIPHMLFSYIINLMVLSMGDSKWELIRNDLEEYKKGLPIDS